MKGKTFSKSPFITSILAPQLQRKNLDLEISPNYKSFLNIQSDYTLLDGDEILSSYQSQFSEIAENLKNSSLNIALTIQKSYKTKVTLLDLGFTYCIDIPVATEVVVKTIENSMQKNKNVLRDSSQLYGSSPEMNYFSNKNGEFFLSIGSRSIHLSSVEKSILSYLQTRNGYATRGELSFAGWRNFSVRPNTVTVAIKKLRHKLSSLKLPYSIVNLYGFGYKLEKVFH